MDNSRTLVAFFSRKGENYLVGSIKEGTGEILAKEAASMLSAPVYEIASEKGYPEDYEECSKAAKAERDSNERPSLRFPLPDSSGLESLILVYPNWWGDLPMPVYTFLDGINTDGLMVYPVCTHEGNGLGMTDRCLSGVYPKARIMPGIAIRGTSVQENRADAVAKLRGYLEKAGFTL